MTLAAHYGHIDIVKFCAEQGATNFTEAMWKAAINGHIDIVKFCAENGATGFHEGMVAAARKGHSDIFEYCAENDRSWGLLDLRRQRRHVVMVRKWCCRFLVRCEFKKTLMQ